MGSPSPRPIAKQGGALYDNGWDVVSQSGIHVMPDITMQVMFLANRHVLDGQN
jgi:hypothetical protein